MKKIVVLICFVLSSSFIPQLAVAQNLRSFLKSCAVGTAAGAGLGVVSLVFSDKPSAEWNNVARGASLGLYAGILYGLYEFNRTDSAYQTPDFAVVPEFKNGKIASLYFNKVLLSF